MCLPLLHTSVVGGRFKEGLSFFYPSSSKRRLGGDVFCVRVRKSLLHLPKCIFLSFILQSSEAGSKRGFIYLLLLFEEEAGRRCFTSE
jgi:hypothetical protein